MMKMLVLLSYIGVSSLCSAEVKVYQTTDNTGLNKREQIDTVEKYLTDLSTTLKSMEAKLDQNSLRLKTLEDTVGVIKNKDLKQIQDQLGAKTITTAATTTTPAVVPVVSATEIEKINADILALKNDDVEVLKGDVQAMKSSLRYIQSLLKIDQK